MSEGLNRLSPVKFGFAFGLVWSISMLLLGWSAWLFDYGHAFVSLFASVYVGYGASFVGGVLGALWGLVDVFVFAWVVAVVYNGCKCPKS